MHFKKTLSQLIHHNLGRVFTTRLKRMTGKGLMEFPSENIPYLEESRHICILNKATKINRGPTTDVSTVDPGFLLHMDFCLFQC